ncbi:MAG: molybdopterin molybdenumtransferase MoeA, partial [Acidimicrobiia bacterium]
MRPLEEARAEVLAAMRRLESESVDITDAGGRILAEDAVAPNAVPPFANSAMDGFAVIASDLERMPVRLQILEDVPAGSVASQAVTPGAAIKIMTGAPMPVGADTVVKVELTRQPESETVEILEAVARGEAVRPAGSDFAAGTTVLAAGSHLGAAELALLS